LHRGETKKTLSILIDFSLSANAEFAQFHDQRWHSKRSTFGTPRSVGELTTNLDSVLFTQRPNAIHAVFGACGLRAHDLHRRKSAATDPSPAIIAALT
jgi:hypothetical protein